MKYKTVILLFSLLGCIGAYLLIKDRKKTAITRDLIVGTAGGYAPFVSVGAHGEYEGFDIDLVHALEKRLSRPIQIRDLGTMSALFLALDSGVIDAIIWGLEITQDRLKVVDMIPYQGEGCTSYPLLFWDVIPAGVSGIEDMKEKTVCVEPGSAQDAVLEKYPLIKKLFVERVDDALLMLEQRKVDAAFIDPAIAKKFRKKHSKIKVVEVPLSPQDQSYGMGIALKKSSGELAEKLKRAIEELQVDGTIRKLEERWGL